MGYRRHQSIRWTRTVRRCPPSLSDPQILISFTVVSPGLARRTLSSQGILVPLMVSVSPSWSATIQQATYEPHLQYQYLCRPIGSLIHTHHHSWCNSYHSQLCHCNRHSPRCRTLRNHHGARVPGSIHN